MKKTLLMLALVAGITSFAQNAQAALISINIGPTGFNIGGINGGVASDNAAGVDDFPISGDLLNLYNFSFLKGMIGQNGLRFAAGTTPVNFSLNASIDSSSSYPSGQESAFRRFGSVSPNFGSGSYMGFRTSQNNYGWLEVTWTASSNQFQILSGAYESTPNVAILAGAGPGPAAVPEPGTWAAAALLVGGAAYAGWRRRKSAKVPL